MSVLSNRYLDKYVKKLNFDHPIITLGSPYGIGCEIFLRSLNNKIFKQVCPVCIGSKQVIDLFLKLLNMKVSYISISTQEIKELPNLDVRRSSFVVINIDESQHILNKIGNISQNIDGEIAYKSIHTGAQLVKTGIFKSVVTLPVSKKNINLIDPQFIGHTEFFRDQWNEKTVFMTFISSRFNVILLTTHLPLNEVCQAITPDLVQNGLEVAGELQKRLNLNKKICFLGLNPHAGENGLLGKEELWIQKTIEKYNQGHSIRIDGPLPSDTVFTPDNRKKYSTYISCYHDQGLIPFKIFSFKDGVNLSFGMNHIRTSVDHGTAINLIGKKKADLKSFINAYTLALKLSKN